MMGDAPSRTLLRTPSGALLLLGIGAAAWIGIPPAEARALAGPSLPSVALQEAGTQQTPPALPPERTVIPDPGQWEATAPTDDPELEANVRKLASQLRCPTCQALSIADSPSELAREMEGQIRDRLQAGMTPEEVRESFVDAYGEWVLLSPRPSGFNLLVYVLPFAGLLLGAGIVVVGMRRWLAQPEHEGAFPPPEDEGMPPSP